jgi:hypothetical protein
MGRAKTSQGLRVTNFNLRACMPQPDYVESFLAEPSEDPIEDMSCCHKQKRYSMHCIMQLWSMPKSCKLYYQLNDNEIINY